LISSNTIEENIFKKSLQKRELGGLIIEGNFDPEIFKKVIKLTKLTDFIQRNFGR
jgi:SNF2 family DNA or RNA helicase